MKLNVCIFGKLQTRAVNGLVAEGAELDLDDTLLGVGRMDNLSVANEHANMTRAVEHVSRLHITRRDTNHIRSGIAVRGPWYGDTLQFPGLIYQTTAVEAARAASQVNVLRITLADLSARVFRSGLTLSRATATTTTTGSQIAVRNEATSTDLCPSACRVVPRF